MLVTGFWLSTESFADQEKPGPEQSGWWLATGDGRRYRQLTEKCECVYEIRNLQPSVGKAAGEEREQYSRCVHIKLGGGHKLLLGVVTGGENHGRLF